jgi:hypothetical protein
MDDDDDDDEDDDDLSHHPSDLNQVPLPFFPHQQLSLPLSLSSRRGHAVIGSCRAWIGQFVKLLQQQSSKQAINQSINPSSKQASKQFCSEKNFTTRLQLRVVCNSETENMFDALCFLIIIFFMCNSSGD